MLAATLASQAYHGDIDSLYLDYPSRFFLSIPIYYALKNSQIRIVQILRYGMPLGAISALCVVLFVRYHGLNEFGSRASNLYLNPIHFGNLSLALGVLSACLISQTALPSLRANALQLSGLIAGLSASALSGTRGGWIAIPIVIIAWLYLSSETNKIKRLVIGLVAMGAVAIASYLLVDVVQQRVHESVAEFTSVLRGDFSSSLGLRMQLWLAGIHMFMENPLFGVGPNEFFSSMERLHNSGVIPPVPSSVFGTEVHSYFIACMAELGALGLLSALAIFFVPLFMFLKASKSKIDTVRISARAGVCFVLSFFVYCLTVEMFNIKMIASFYGLTVAVLLAAAHTMQTDKEEN